MLKTLLNYLIYYEMVKKEVCTKANEFLTAYDDALEEHTELLKKNKQIETRATEVSFLWKCSTDFANSFWSQSYGNTHLKLFISFSIFLD